jgi:hypothetical protein
MDDAETFVIHNGDCLAFSVLVYDTASFPGMRIGGVR